MTTRRDVLLDALDEWRREGVLDDATHKLLRSRYENAPRGELDAPLGVGAGAAADEAAAHGFHRDAPGELPRGAGSQRSYAADVTQFVGGLLLGASLVALVVFLGLEDDAARWALAGLGTVGVGIAIAAMMRLGDERASLVEAAFAVGLVPLGVAATLAFENGAPMSALIAAIAVGVHALKHGRGASILLCVAVASIASFSATIQFFGDDVGATRRLAWLALLLAYLVLTLVWRREAWSSAAAGALVIPLTIGFVMLLDELATNADSVVLELLVGLFLAGLLGVGVWLGVRGLVASAAAGLTIDAIVFAFDVGGPGTAVIVLLALGGLLVWQGHMIRGYFRRTR